MILDLYAGAGGWDEGARHLGLPTVGLEIWHDACVTAVRAGHPRIRCDIAAYPTAPFAGRVTGLIASPPCQAWSMAGNRKGEQDKARVHELVNAYAAAANEPGDGWADPRSHHAAQPVRWIRELRPEWVCLEQVPPVIDLWRHIGDVLRGWGYAVWVGVLNAADYGVPQTRHRAILIASRVRTVHQPETTHEQYPPADALFGARLPWVTMAEALGWAGVDRPARTVCGDRSPRWMYGQANSYATGWTLVNRRDSPKWVAEHGERRNRESDEPAPTITGEAHRWAMTRPATTVQGDPQDSLRVTTTEAAILQSFRADYPWHGNKTSQFLQVGNAVPPGLAAAVLAVAAGVPATTEMGLAA
jgi:DNA (cytosine-5)-methyltransferase 1